MNTRRQGHGAHRDVPFLAPASAPRRQRRRRSLIEDFPPEILSLIYYFYVPFLLVTRTNDFMAVCKLWESIANLPSAWTCISVKIPRTSRANQRLRGVLSKSNTLPLSLFLSAHSDYDGSEPRMEFTTIVANSRRLQRLTFDLKGLSLLVLSPLRQAAFQGSLQLEILEEFVLTDHNIEGGNITPSFHSYDTGQNVPRYNIPDRTIFEPTLDEILRCTRNLRILSISRTDSSLNGLLRTIVHLRRSLSELVLQSSCGSFRLDILSLVQILHNCHNLTIVKFSFYPCDMTPVYPDSYEVKHRQPILSRVHTVELSIRGNHLDQIIPATFFNMLNTPRLTRLDVTWQEDGHSPWRGSTVTSIRNLVQRSRCQLQRLGLTDVYTQNAAELLECISPHMRFMTLAESCDKVRTLIGSNMVSALRTVKGLKPYPYAGNRRIQYFARR